MRISRRSFCNRVAPVLFLLGFLGYSAGCGDSAAPIGGPGPAADTQAKQDAEKEARMRNYGTKSGLAPGTKKEAEKAPKP
jgi:hypothetical protein